MGKEYATICVRTDGQEKERLQEAWKEALHVGDPAMTGDVVRFSEKNGRACGQKTGRAHAHVRQCLPHGDGGRRPRS